MESPCGPVKGYRDTSTGLPGNRVVRGDPERLELRRRLADKLLNSIPFVRYKKNPDQFYWKDCRLKSLREEGVLSRFSDIAPAYIVVW